MSNCTELFCVSPTPRESMYQPCVWRKSHSIWAVLCLRKVDIKHSCVSLFWVSLSNEQCSGVSLQTEFHRHMNSAPMCFNWWCSTVKVCLSSAVQHPDTFPAFRSHWLTLLRTMPRSSSRSSSSSSSSTSIPDTLHRHALSSPCLHWYLNPTHTNMHRLSYCVVKLFTVSLCTECSVVYSALSWWTSLSRSGTGCTCTCTWWTSSSSRSGTGCTCTWWTSLRRSGTGWQGEEGCGDFLAESKSVPL